MQFDNVEIPYGAYWSTPFAKWQGSLQHLHSMKLAAHVAKAELAKRGIEASSFDFGVLGMTVNQLQSFGGAPWPLYDIGLKSVTGPTISQACATGARVLLTAAAEIQCGLASVALALMCDRTSNAPHIYYPEPGRLGGTGDAEDQMLLNLSRDPIAGHSMLQTAENVAKKFGISTSQQHEVTLRRYEQYGDALKEDRAFQRRYMSLPFAVPRADFRTAVGELAGDEGIFATTAEGLAKLRPSSADGTVTRGAQTHPADGNCGVILTTKDDAQRFSRDRSIRIRLLGFGQARAELAYMPEAPIAATHQALKAAGLRISDVAAVKSHNPFAVNDIVFSRATGFDVHQMNNYGCSLIWGHPQAPTGGRAIIELIEELALRGGGVGLFQGCAAGDSSIAVVLKVDG